MPSGRPAVIYDCSGASRYRAMWDHFVAEADGVIYVIDSADTQRVGIVKENIEEFIRHPLLRHKPIVFLANKQDHPDALKKEEVKRILGLDKRLISNPFSVKPAKSMSGMGLNDALTFIETNMTSKLF